MNEEQVKSFWQTHPCGDMQVGGLGRFGEDYCAFFDQYDAFRYVENPELLRLMDEMGFSGKTVLEIGPGEGADAEQIIRRGGIWSGLDLTAESVKRVGIRLRLRQLLYKELKQGTVRDLPFDSNSFDKVYSCGVLHHVPEIKKAAQEIHRVLKPDGELIVMLYAKVSLNYLVSICILRRLLLACAYLAGVQGAEGSKLSQHIKNAKESGLFNYLKMRNFIHRNTDGPLNPYTKVYTLGEVKRDFPDFEIVKCYKTRIHAPPLPVHGFPGGKIMGWHLWVHVRPV
jgi:ubiquinone/menaquinone biosynthesis C-methylase UbiE